MNNLQKLYQTIFEAGLINNSFEDFSQGMLGEDYQKKVFDAITDKGLFSQDFNTFKSGYSPKKVKIFGKEKDQDDLSFFESLAVSMKNKFPEISKTLDWYSAYTVDVGVDLADAVFGDAFSTTPKDVVDKEFGGDFKSAIDKSSDKDASTKNVYFIDPLTKNKIVFDKKAFESKGHYAEENERWYELARLAEKSDDIESGFIDSDANAIKADMAMPVIKRALETEKEIQEFTSRDTTGFTDAMKKGKTKDASLYAIDFAGQMLKSIVLAKLTRGASLYAEAVSSTYQGFNLEKANALYGGRDEESVRKLMANGESEVLIPTAAAGFVAALDKLGLDGLSGKYFKNILAHRKALTLLVGSGTEGATEYTQGLLERFNNNLGAQMSVKEAAEDVAEYAGSDEALDQFFAGLIGGGMIQGGGMTYNAAFRRDEASIDFIDKKINNINKLQEEAYKLQDPEVIKANKAKVDQEFKELKLYLKRNKDASEFLTDKGKKEIIDLANSRESVQKKIKELNNLKKKGAITKEAAEVRLNQYQSQLKEINSKTTEIRNEAVKSKLQADLKTSGFAVENIDELNQVVVKDGKELFEKVDEWYKRHGLENPYTQSEFESQDGGDALILGNNIFINEKNAVKNSAFGVGTHEFLHAVIKSVIRKKDGSGELSDKGVNLVKDFLNTLSRSDRAKVEKRMRDEYEEGLSEEQNFRIYGEEALTYYVQLKKEKRLTKSAAQRGMMWLKNSFSKETPYKNLDITDGKSFQNFLDIFVSDAEQGQFRSEFVALAKQGVEETVAEKEQTTKAAASKTTRRAKRSRTATERQITEKAKAAQSEVDEIGKKATSKAEYDAGINVEAYTYLTEGGGLSAMIKAQLLKYDISVSGKDANVYGQPLELFIEDVKGKVIPAILGFNPEKETTSEGKFGLSGWVNFNLNKRVLDSIGDSKKTVVGVSLNKKVGDSDMEVGDFLYVEGDKRIESFEEQNLSVYSETQQENVEITAEQEVLQSKYRHKLKNQDGSKLIGVSQVENIREGLRKIFRTLQTEISASEFLLNFENMVKKTMKNIVQGAIGTKETYRKFLINNIETIVEYSSLQDLVALERLVGKGKTKGGRKIFTVPVKRLTKKEDIQKAIDQGKLPPDAINKSEEGVFLSEKRVPTQEELEAYFLGKNMMEVLGYEVGSSTLGTRKDGLSRMVTTSLAQDATMETIQEPDILEEASVFTEGLSAEIQVGQLAGKINKSPFLKFSRSAFETLDSSKHEDYKSAYKGFENGKFLLAKPKGIDQEAYDYAYLDFVRSKSDVYKVTKLKELRNKLYGKNADYSRAKYNEKLSLRIERIARDNINKVANGIPFVDVVLADSANSNLPDILLMFDGKDLLAIEVKADSARTSSITAYFTLKLEGILGLSAQVQQPELLSDIYKEKAVPVLKKMKKRLKDRFGIDFDGSTTELTPQQYYYLQGKFVNGKKIKGLSNLMVELNAATKTSVDSSWASFGYLNKSIPSQYINLGLAGLFHFGKESNDIMNLGTKSFDGVQIPLSFRISRHRLANGNFGIRIRVDAQLSSQAFAESKNHGKSNINVMLEAGGRQFFKNKDGVKRLEVRGKRSKSESINKASELARLTNKSTPSRGMSIFDFDETVGVSENVVIANKDGVVKEVSSDQWPHVGEQLKAEGWTFDFSDFNKVTKGKPGPLMQKLKNQISKYGNKNVFILTARAPQSQKAIFEWLKSQGIILPYENITGLGNSAGNAKAQWILDKYAEGYNDIYFVDDAMPNVEAVQDVFNQLDIKGKSVRAIPDITKQKIQFSKTELSSTVNSPQYKQFKNSIKDRVLYHGGSETINTIRDNNAVWFYLDDADAAQMWGDGEVYSVKASDIQDMVIIPDLNDVSTFTKHIQEKFNLGNKAYDVREIMSHPKADEIIKEWIEWSAENNMEYDLGYNLYEKGKVTNGAAVTVLGVIPKNKIQQISSKFSKSSLRGDKAVKNVFDQLDIKGKSVQAKIKFSKTKKENFDSILKRTVGIDQEIDPARAKIIGAKKGKREFFIAPGADDFQGLMMRLAGKGEQGESDMKFFKQVFFDPFNRAYRKLNSIQYNMMEGYNKIRKTHRSVIKILKKKFDNEFTNEDAIRIYLWDLQDIEVPGLTTKERKAIAAKVAQNADMVSFALDIRETLQLSGEYVAPKETWSVGSIKGDMYEALNSVHRNKALQEWQENIDELLDNPEMLAKLEASMGKSYVEALKDMLYRMRTGKNRPTGPNAMTNKAMNWLQGAVGAIMFFNSRSAVLQTISTINFINHTDNNIFAFAKAIANVSQFAEDFKMLFNSPQLKVRRSGLQQDIQTADLADSLSRGGGASGALAYLLKIGFLPTQIADSFAIAFGGAAFYRNRVNSLMKQGMTQEQAESQAMIDFQDITEESQQSSRPDRISQQQAAPVGRLLLAFQNTPLQYNRIIKKAITDIANKRGDIKTHISRIAYYGAIQSLIFYTLQQALFAEDDPEEEQIPSSVKKQYKKGIKDGTINRFEYPSVKFYYADTKAKQKQESLVNSMADGWLRGSGVKGAIVSTFKNVVRSFMKESEKGYKADYFNTFIEVLNVSPQIGSKARKIKKASDTYKYNKDVMSEIGAFDIDNPVYPMAFSLIEGVTNAPTHRIYTKLDNLKEAFNEDNTAMQRTFVSLGWNQWQLGIDTYKDVREAKEKIKEREKAKKKQCRQILNNGKRCSIRTTNKSQLCYHHN